MEIIIGVGLAFAVGIGLTWVGMDRDRSLYPAIAIVIASLYILYAVIGGSTQALILESVVAAGFIGLAVLGFRISLWFAVISLAGHGVFDLVHEQLIANPGVPGWWPLFCGSYDIVAAGYLAILVSKNRIRAVS